MTSAETRYAQIEKEMLAITFACERFHQYIHGQDVAVETDHKPLITLFKKPLNDCPMRIQRLMLRLQKYSLDVSYTPGKFMYTSDALSRAYDTTTIPSDKTGEEEIETYVDFVMSNVQVSDRKLEEIQLETQNDEEMNVLAETILNGFPDKRSDCSPKIYDYWNVRNELSVVNGIIMRNNKVVIPRKLRHDMLKKIHVGHLGIEKCRKRARQVIDNGPQFACGEFEKFSKEYDFSHKTSSPNFPQSNGLVEKSVSIVKNLIKKSKEDGSDFYLGLLSYRSTPIINGKSPAELLYGRTIRSNLPINDQMLRTPVKVNPDEYLKNKMLVKEKQKQYYDKTVRELPPLRQGDSVRIRDVRDTAWTTPAVVKTEVAPRSYLIKTKTGSELRRNRKDLLKCESPVNINEELDPVDDEQFYDCEDELIPQSTRETYVNQTKPVPVTTRSGRVVTPRHRLIEDM
ncbi:uncharacterized protein [Argopecten irradians]|uniref:uncharacterized protein n=1 Tax=Argopecten irradians TaxID=31199 RepID=UPI003719E013